MSKRKTSGKFKVFAIFLLLVLFVLFSVKAVRYALYHMYPVTYSEYVEKYSEEYALDKHLVYSIIKAESGFDPSAVSSRNAKGLMQIMDSTGEWAAEMIKLKNYSADRLLQPETNIHIGCWYMARLLKQYNQNTEMALVAYNAGSGNVSKWLNDDNISSNGKTLDRIPFEETRNYVDKINKYYKFYKKLYADGHAG